MCVFNHAGDVQEFNRKTPKREKDFISNKTIQHCFFRLSALINTDKSDKPIPRIIAHVLRKPKKPNN